MRRKLTVCTVLVSVCTRFSVSQLAVVNTIATELRCWSLHSDDDNYVKSTYNFPLSVLIGLADHLRIASLVDECSSRVSREVTLSHTLLFVENKTVLTLSSLSHHEYYRTQLYCARADQNVEPRPKSGSWCGLFLPRAVILNRGHQIVHTCSGPHSK